MTYPVLIGIAALTLLINVGLGGLLSIEGVRPSLCLPLVVYIGLQRGPIEATLIGAGLGLAEDIFGAGALGLTMFSYAVAGFASGKLWNSGPFRVLWPWGGFVIVAALFTEAVSHYMLSRAMGLGFFALYLRSGIPAAFYTTVLALMWFLSPLHRVRPS